MSMKAYVVNEDWSGRNILYVIQTIDNKRFALSVNGDTLTRTEIEEGQENAPALLRLNGPMAQSIFPAIVAALSAKGFERPSESTLRGRCEAMAHHLSDLRHILKLPPSQAGR